MEQKTMEVSEAQNILSKVVEGNPDAVEALKVLRKELGESVGLRHLHEVEIYQLKDSLAFARNDLSEMKRQIANK